MKKFLILTALAVFAVPAFAEKKPGGFMEKLTDEQRACIDAQGCPKIEFKKDDENPDKESMKEARECRKNAFEVCGIEKPEKKDGERKFKKFEE